MSIRTFKATLALLAATLLPGLALGQETIQGVTYGPEQVYQGGAQSEGDITYEGDNYFEGAEGCGDDCHYVYSHLDIMFLERDVSNDIQFTSVPGLPLVTTDDLEFDAETVPRITIGIPLEAHSATLEVNYFGLQTWEDQFALADVGLSLQTLEYESRIDNGEINVIHWCPCCSCSRKLGFLVGARYFRLEEELDYAVFSGPLVSDREIRTRNDMVGFQIGSYLSQELTCCLRVEGEVKAGVFANNARQVTNGEERAEDDSVSFLSDAGLTAVYDCCGWLSIRAGYHVLYVDGVALGPDNFVPATPALAELNDDGDVLYHGATAGLEIRF